MGDDKVKRFTKNAISAGGALDTHVSKPHLISRVLIEWHSCTQAHGAALCTANATDSSPSSSALAGFAFLVETRIASLCEKIAMQSQSLRSEFLNNSYHIDNFEYSYSTQPALLSWPSCRGWESTLVPVEVPGLAQAPSSTLATDKM